MKTVNPNDYKDLDNAYKIALVAVEEGNGDLHTCLVSSLTNKGADKMMFGEFITGITKELIHEHPKTGFLIMSISRDFWTGKMDFTHKVHEGEDYVKMNEYPLFRFNTYFGVHTVHYADLVDISERQAVNMPGVIANAVWVILAKCANAGPKSEVKPALRPWAKKFLNGLLTLKYISYMGEDGYPKIVPIIQAQAANDSRVVFTRSPYAKMLSDLREGVRVNVYAVSLDMEVLLVKGTYRKGKLGLGVVDIDKVYNSAPPKMGYTYPAEKNEAVNFADEPLAPYPV
ncbi:MAG: hypothetical protein IKF96_05270 [Eggerthellaceae bacterium]|nr:hypothetical protein [Eggerthellaceae bacterium]